MANGEWPNVGKSALWGTFSCICQKKAVPLCPIMRRIGIFLYLLCACAAWGTQYSGRVVDEKGAPIAYATVYPQQQPELGTATNNDGRFVFEAELSEGDLVIFSFIGYEKITVTGDRLRVTGDSLTTIVLKEQPIQLEETVVAAKTSKQRNKRKQMAALLHSVYVQMERDFPKTNTRYSIVSDVVMRSEKATWGMEQMIADIVVLPEAAQSGKDSVQFQGKFCKRFFDAAKREAATAIMSGETLDRLEKDAKLPAGAPKNLMHRAANSIDSGVVVHRAIFGVSDIKYDFQENMNDLKHWTVSNESEHETVLTYTQKVSKYLGFFRMIYKRHYIVDSETYSVKRFSEHAEVKVTIPFGYKLNADQLQLLNLLNMGENELQKFRMKKLRASVDLNTILERVTGDGLRVKEKNMKIDAKFVGTQKKEVPIHLRATQRVTGVQTKDVKALRKDQITRRLERKIVEIY